MSRNNRQIKSTPSQAEKNFSIRFIFLAKNCNPEGLKILSESISRIKKELLSRCSFLIADSQNGRVSKMAGENSHIISESLRIITENTRISEILPPAANSRDIWLNLENLTNPIIFNDFFRSELPEPEEDEFFLLNWETKSSSEISGCLLNKTTSEQLLSLSDFVQNPDYQNFQRQLRVLNLKKSFCTLNHPYPYSLKSVKSLFRFNPVASLKQTVSWAINLFSIKPLANRPFNFSNQQISRIIFFTVALLSFLVLPLISYNAGISGDEEKHYAQAAKVYNYFATAGKDTSALTDEKYKLNYYGQSFDLMTYTLIKTFHIEKIYEARHVMNGFAGATAILCSGLLARILLGNIAGIFTMVLLLISPGFIGHAMNNPLDVPFALGYIFTLLQLVRFLKRLPVIDYGVALLITLGIAFTISIRIGGLILIPYIFMFSGLYLLFTSMPWKNFSPHWVRFAVKGFAILSGISVLSYFLSILVWPYALQNPIKNPFEAMKIMENITVALRVMFEGKIIWSDNLPASYIPKNILLSIPLIVFAGFTAAFFFIRKHKNFFWIFLLFFVVVFPVAYIIYKESNVYGAWRHLLFIYPPMVVMAGMGMQSLFEISRKKIIRYAILAVFLATLINPVSHIFRNYPNQYIYFNELVGGVKKAYKKYETDYYMVSLKPGTDWIKRNILNKESTRQQPVRIISNAPTDIMNYYFRDYKGKVALPYTRYYDRGMSDWDYAIFFCNYIDPYQLTHNIWPPKNTIYTVDIDGVKICAVVKRENRDDFMGVEFLNSALKNRSKSDLDQSVILFENALKYDPHNEITYLNLAQAYIFREEFDKARKKLYELLSFYPNYDKAINVIGYSYLNEGEIKGNSEMIERAITLFNEVLKINYKFAGAYHNLGLASMIQGDDDKAFGYFQKSIDNNPTMPDSYFSMANLFEKRGDLEQARKIREYARGL